MVGRFHRAEDGGLLVAHAPVPRRDEGALPHAGLGLARGLFVRLVIPGETHIGERPAARDQPFLDVLAVDGAARDGAAAAIGRACLAGPALAAGILDQLVARGDPAGPALAGSVEAKLVNRGGIDATEPQPVVADDDLVGLADLR